MLAEVPVVKEWIGSNLKQISSVNDIARAFGVQPKVLQKRFKDEEGIPIWRFVCLSRVDRMKKLLLQDNMDYLQVCNEVGLKHEETASRLFREFTGVTMVEFRNMFLKN